MNPNFAAFIPSLRRRGPFAVRVIQFETNRAKFVGRGPDAAQANCAGYGCRIKRGTGRVLDPIACMRVSIALEPGQSQEVAFILGAAKSRSEIDQSLVAVQDMVRTVNRQHKAMTIDSGNGDTAPFQSADVS